MNGRNSAAKRSVGALFVILMLHASQPVFAVSVGRCGGTGGASTKTLTCPAGQYVVGIYGRGGGFLDSFGIRCAPIAKDGKRGAVGGLMTGGGTGGTLSRDGICSGDRAVFALRFKSGMYVDNAMAGGCRGKDERSVGTPAVVSLNVGGPGGINCATSCAAEEWMTSVKIRYGGWVESIESFCSP